MHLVCTILGWLLASAAAGLFLLGLVSWPPGGLMFAAPYFFFLLGAVTAVPAWLLIWLGRRLRRAAAGEERT